MVGHWSGVQCRAEVGVHGKMLVVRSRRVEEVLVVVARGVLTVEGAREIRWAVGAALAKADARAIVIDLRGAVLLFTEATWSDLVEESADAAIQHPIGILVSPQVVA